MTWSLYKYQPVDSNTLRNLKKQALWASHPSAFNDPFEFRLRQQEEARGLQTLRAQNPHLDHVSDRELISRAASKYEDQIRSMGVISLTEVPDSIPMWAHYADNHRGILLELVGKDGNQKPQDAAIYPVDYTSEYPALDFEQVWHREGMAKVLWTKSPAWEAECEWRLIRMEGGELVDYPGRLESICFGLRTPREDAAKVMDCVGPNVTYRKVERDGRRYHLHIRNIAA